MEGENGGIIEAFFSILLGILPSFLLFSIFNQSGFSIIRYKDFLIDFNSSWASWVSLIIIAIVVFFLLRIIQSKKKKAAVLLIGIGFAIGAVILILYANFLLGNDLLVKLSSDKEHIFFNDSSEQNVIFTMSTLMNPFCIAHCEYSFVDLSSGENIDSGEFISASLFQKNQEYKFSSEGQIKGQKLHKFEIICNSQKTRLCYTNEENSKRSILITLNYDLSEEQKIKNQISKQEIISLEREIYNFTKTIEETDIILEQVSNFTPIQDFISELNNLSYSLSELNNSFLYLKEEWMSQEYLEFEKEFPILKKKLNFLIAKKDAFVSNVNSNISKYNLLSKKLEGSREFIEDMNSTKMSEGLCQEVNKLVLEFNQTVHLFNQKSNLSEKEKRVNNFLWKVNEVYDASRNGGEHVCIITNPIKTENLTQIRNISGIHILPDLYLEDPYPICCIYGKCERCCDESCSNKSYPVIFLHGHSINKATSADYSLDTFSRMKSELEKEGYINAGSVIISKSEEQKGLWGKTNAPIEVTASYFFDITKSETGEETIVPSKTVGIDTYALRLNDLVNIVKDRTGKDKVIIVAHSMGGLVTRRYVNIFGENDLDRIILISVPNQGIEAEIKNYCSLIGSKMECDDMDKDSIFINKLSNARNISIPLYNIIGNGCKMGEASGDGIVTESSQYLMGAKNYYIEGVCNEIALEFVHGELLNPNKYPKTLELLKEFLKEEI